ncbi:Uncharacterised protein [Vibrio cholerae]|nr:Uncharacterised protein [Vibrio cholerae]
MSWIAEKSGAAPTTSPLSKGNLNFFGFSNRYTPNMAMKTMINQTRVMVIRLCIKNSRRVVAIRLVRLSLIRCDDFQANAKHVAINNAFNMKEERQEQH